MKNINQNVLKAVLLPIFTLLIAIGAKAQKSIDREALDKKVNEFLIEQKDEWRYWNVPYQDGKVLHDLIVKNKYTSVLEIGTSTGHSTIWLAWAMSKNRRESDHYRD